MIIFYKCLILMIVCVDFIYLMINKNNKLFYISNHSYQVKDTSLYPIIRIYQVSILLFVIAIIGILDINFMWLLVTAMMVLEFVIVKVALKKNYLELMSKK
ncbi:MULTISPECIES: hypothetical protein [Turicibacter]|nr:MULTISPECIES: hypothetical protein [Turicibacter]MCU7189993.1 hypothetical protein [Turicibacter sanguinis]MCU7196842.1 hypothetical protein [Turicibacter sanguinis]MCU7201071.1 hypothetical protein [Turicibacter sanguinis]MCU7211484.1 hypothetical protein [Turicibacter sanguinis]MDB8437976.1 hypothetical protein [Turicibacter sanguinis]